MERITNGHLEHLVNELNRKAGTNPLPYSDRAGKMVANIGNYHLEGAYGGQKLAQMVNEGGATRDISKGGFESKRSLYVWISAFIDGMNQTGRSVQISVKA